MNTDILELKTETTSLQKSTSLKMYHNKNRKLNSMQTLHLRYCNTNSSQKVEQIFRDWMKTV